MRPSILSLTLVCVVGISGLVSAKDTDIYLMAPTTSRDDSPNVLIIFDNSGSMESNSITTRAPFNPSTNYCTLAGNPGIPCDRVYWSFTGSPPGTGSSSWVAATKNHCEDSKTVLANTGFYSGTKIAGFKSTGSGKGWRTLSARQDSELAYVDCQIDGSNVDGYARAGSTTVANAYTSTQSQEFVWSNFNTNAAPTLYSAQYMNYWHNSTLSVSQTRLQIAKNAMKNVVDANRSVRFGLMVFNVNGDGTNGGRVVMKVDTMDDARRTVMKNTIDGLVGDTWTPLSETLWEARQYFGGLAVDYGNDASSPTPARDLTAESGGTYVTPFKYGCQKSYIVYMTDGDPTQDADADASPRVKGLPGLTTSTCQGVAGSSGDGTNSCLKDLAGWMHDNDVVGNSILPGNQTVTTYTIGFGSGISAAGKTLLQQTAAKGGGKYYAADDADQLSSAFQNAITEILQTNASFSSPSLSINAFNRLFNRDDLYFALFKPSSSVGWDGNVKKFRLCNSSDVTTFGCVFGDVIDSNGAAAMDINSKIKDAAVSFWGTVADGANVTIGGAGAQIPAPSTRSLYTYRGSYTGLSTASPATPTEVKPVAGNPLYDAAINDPTILGISDTSGSPTTTNAADTAEVTKLINWMRGEDSYDKNSNGSTTDNRWRFGDPLHSRPVAITYGAELTSGNPDPTKPIIKLFVGSNDGVVRIINNSTGAEEWSFIPSELLNQQYNLSQDPDGAHVYGLDGSTSFWINDVNNNGIIEPSVGDRVYMYIGMRRGGRNIYAFDMTPSSTVTLQTQTITPKLIWAIQGGSGDFAKLGETWSRPQVVRVKFKCTGVVCNDGNPATNDSESRMVVIFAGGYDPNQDNSMPPAIDSMGNAIYIVDPLTGQRIWWASNDASATSVLANMQYSIPSDLTLMDSNADGSVDRIYVGDMGGQIWRIDLGDQLDTNANGGTTGYVFADVGCAGGTRTDNCSATANQDRRKFFYPPDVAQVDDPTFSADRIYDLVTIGSGDREDPLDLLTTNLPLGSKEAVHNRIYAFRDIHYRTGTPKDSSGTAITPAAITDAALYDATADKLGTLTGTAAQTEIDTNVKNKKGYFIDLKETTSVTLANGLTTVWVGEKVLSKTVIFGGTLFVTTFVPANNTNAQTSCAASEGAAKLFALNYLTGSASADFNNDGTKERVQALGGGIPSEAVIVIREGGTTSLVGTSGGAAKVGTSFKNDPIKTYWYED